MTLREQFYRHDEASRLTNIERHERRKRRIALIIATAIARAHCAAHGTPSDVDLSHKRLRSRKTTVTVTVETEDLFD